MERKAKEAVRKAIGQTFEFGCLKIMTTFRMLFLAGMVFVCVRPAPMRAAFISM